MFASQTLPTGHHSIDTYQGGW